MMKLFRICVALLLFITLVVQAPLAVLAAEAGEKAVTVLSNNYIKITVDNNTGRFGIRTVEGQPIRKKDQNVNMIFGGDDPETSFTTFRIDGTDYIFGNPYKFASGIFSEISKPLIVSSPAGTKQIETVWTIKGVAIKQILMMYADSNDKLNAGNVNIRYEVSNNSNADVQMGSRILLDTMVAGNDGPAFQVGTAYKVPLQVERKLTHHPEDDSTISEAERALYKLPAYWVMKDKLDLSNPLATNVFAYGFNNFSEADIHLVDEMIVGHWNKMANTKWDYTVNPNLDFTTDTNDYGTADSAVAFYWNPDRVAKGSAATFETVYGLGEIVEPEKVFSIRYMDPVNQLAALEDGSGYEAEGVFDITAEIENLASYNMEHSKIQAELSLENGLDFVKLDTSGNIVRDSQGKIMTLTSRTSTLSFQKEATPQEAAQGIQPKYKPGETITASFKVKAKGKSWPTTKEYLITAKSPETESKLENIKDEGIKAAYSASKSNFVFLPPVGHASSTYVYAMSPEEAYSTDVKYITLNLSNIEAYNVGNGSSEPNFDLFFKEAVTGKRYKVPVKSSVIMQPSDNGEVGDMRITYRTGDLVDNNGAVVIDENGKRMTDLGPELPLGEYVVELDYRGDAGGDPEVANLFDITTQQRFAVTENDEARVRKANILAVVKKTVDLNVDFTRGNKEEIEEAFPGYTVGSGAQLAGDVAAFSAMKLLLKGASKLVDPELDMESAVSVDEVPAYQLMSFESDDELEQFKEDNKDDEVLVEITGMINRIGSGDDAEYVVDTKTEPALINKAVAYRGKDMVFVKGKLNVFGLSANVANIPFFNSLTVKGDGTLSVASSGFVFHKGEWTLDFYNGFDKSLGGAEDEEGGNAKEENEPNGAEDDSLNGSLKWAVGGLGDRLNPLRQLMIEDVYFNKQSLFSAPSFSINGFGLQFNDFILREGGISFGGTISLKILDAEMKNVIFNDQGFVGIDAGLKFDLSDSIGLIGGNTSGGEEKGSASGEINIVHYEQEVEGVDNKYGLKFEADLKGVTTVAVEIEFKQVADKRILPNVIAFSADLGDPGVMIAGGTYLTSVRGAIRELADTIAGGTSDIPLTIEAGADISFGVQPATFYGSIDLTLKRSGIKLVGKLDYSASSTSERLEMLKSVTVAAQWMTPWFVSASAELDVLGWDVIIGKASIYIGQNLLKNRIDFEGFIGAKVQVPSDVPVLGGIALGGISLGVNNDKMWGSLSILFFTLGLTYYFDGDIEFGTSGEGLPEGYAYLQVQDPETGPKLIVLGQGLDMLATSWKSEENEIHEIIYRNVADGVSLLDNGSMNVGIGGIETSNGGKTHVIPMDKVSGDALLEVQYFGNTLPKLELRNNAGEVYPLVFDNTRKNPNANAFVQVIPAQIKGSSADVSKVYIAVPKGRTGGGSWTLVSDQTVKSKLLNIPQVAKLKEIKLDQSGADANKFKAAWQVTNAKPGDKINLYLTKDAVTAATTTVGGVEVPNPGDAGLLIAKDVDVADNGAAVGDVTTGSVDIDVTRVALLGDTEDIRGLLSQGDYYLRAELKSSSNFETQTTTNKFKIIDPLAPSAVSDVQVNPAGNGFFELSFKPAAKKPNQAAYEHNYAIEVLQQSDGRLVSYPSFGSLLFDETELKPYWNESSGKYEHIRLGGWTAVSTSSQVNHDSLAGKSIDTPIKYTGLQVGQSYVVGVSAAVKPPKAADKNENLHYASRIDTANTLLPIPSKPLLSVHVANSNLLHTEPNAYIELLANTTKQSVEIAANQRDVEIETIYAESSLGKIQLANNAGGSAGTLELDSFTTDGTYAIELKARNKNTGDFSITMLYLTVDTIAPVLYIDSPLTGDRTKDGKIAVSGTTSNDATLQVNGTVIAVAKNGKFSGSVAVAGSDPTNKLEFVAYDRAGNHNQASVIVTNDSFKVPVALVLRAAAPIKPNQSKQIEAFLRLPDGKDSAGKPKYKEIAVPQDKQDQLSFTSYLGDAATVSQEGLVAGVKDGASIISAQYKLSADASLGAMTVVTIDSGLETISAYAASVTSNSRITRITVQSAGDLTGNELVYRVYPGSGNAALPSSREDLSSWSLFPAHGEIAATAGDKIVLAKRNAKSKLAVGTSQPITAIVWAESGGGTPGGIGTPEGGSVPVGSGGTGGGLPGDGSALGGDGTSVPGSGTAEGSGQSSGSAETKVNDHVITVQKKDGIVFATIKEDDVNASASNQDQLSIGSNDKTADGYEFNLSKDAWQQAADRNQSVSIDLPIAKLVFPASAAAGFNENLKVRIAKNSQEDGKGFAKIASELQANLLGEGQGVTFDIQAPNAYKAHSVFAKIAIPDNIVASDITAVVLKDANGHWTTVPWSLDIAGNKAYVEVQLTGNGSMAFIGNHPDFVDVKDSNWAKNSISDAAGKLFMLGRKEGRFDPNDPITRAEYPSVLLRVMGLMNESASESFTDVDKTNWFSESVAIAANKGIVKGFKDGSYRPAEKLSRLEAMVMAGRSMDLIGMNSSMTDSEANSILSAFKDQGSIPDWARAAIALCIKNGIIAGQNGYINPDDALTRAQTAAIAIRLSDLIPTSKP